MQVHNCEDWRLEMLAIAIITFAAVAGTSVVFVATALIIVGIHHEERRKTLAQGNPPTIPALLARRLLGARYRWPRLFTPARRPLRTRRAIPPDSG